ncbi:MAG: 16S rRNA (guanine(527)-N(7))-methyltransferase RsmG [Burkholderiaceae bacterium]
MQGFNRPALGAQLGAGAQALGISLSERQRERLLDYLALMVKWNGVYNLTAIRDPAQMVSHHLLDSLAAVPAYAHAQRVLDVGAGGGLPGIVLAIWAAETHPDMRITLVDTVHKKTAFLTQVKAELGLSNVTVYTARVEQLQVAEQFDVITSRAFAELKDFIAWSAHLLAKDGQFIALKGILPKDEMARLPQGWKVSRVQPLSVPGLDAQRHLLFIEREQEYDAIRSVAGDG